MASINVWSEGHVKTLRLEAAVVALAGTTLGLAALLGWQLLRPVPVCYGTAAVAPGLLVPGRVPEAYVRALSEQIVLTLYNVTPVTVEAAHQRVEPLFHPRLLLAFRVRAEAERTLITDHDLSTQLGLQATTVRTSEEGFEVRIESLRRVYAGTTAIRDEALHAVLRLHPVQPTPLNPYGLALVHLAITPALEPKA